MLVLPFRYGMPAVSVHSNLRECKIVYVEHAYKSMKAEMLNRCELLSQIIKKKNNTQNRYGKFCLELPVINGRESKYLSWQG